MAKARVHAGIELMWQGSQWGRDHRVATDFLGSIRVRVRVRVRVIRVRVRVRVNPNPNPNPNQVKTLTGAAQGGACQALTAALGCGFHTKLQLLKRKQGGQLEHPEKQLHESERTLPDIEDFVSLSSQKELCPFYYARELQREAEMLFVPYNYLIDPSARRALNIELAEDVIIFDEAHNMERACTDAASVDLSAAQLVGCVKALQDLSDAIGCELHEVWSHRLSTAPTDQRPALPPR